MRRHRAGVALAVIIGVVSLIAILAVATLSLAGRLQQGSTLAIRDARLDAAAAFGLTAVVDEWRQREIGRLALGSSISFSASPAGVPVSVSVTVTRVGSTVFWVVAEAASGEARRSENIVLRGRIPVADSLIEEDSTNVVSLGALSVDSLAQGAEVQAPAAVVMSPTTGFIHISGDATLLGGSGSGMLIVDGRLVIAGPLSYEGIIIAKGGISVTESGVQVRGLIRAAGNPRISGNLDLLASGGVVQNVMLQLVKPVPVSGRPWAELY